MFIYHRSDKVEVNPAFIRLQFSQIDEAKEIIANCPYDFGDVEWHISMVGNCALSCHLAHRPLLMYILKVGGVEVYKHEE